MPIKRRVDKSRKLDEMKLEELLFGPGTCLFNGEGYLAPYGDGIWHHKSSEVQAAVLVTMRADWHRYQSQILQAWDERTEHDRYIAREHFGDPPSPWAMREFGDP